MVFFVEITSNEKIEIEPKVDENRQIIVTFIEQSILIVNEMVGAIDEMKTESDIHQIYESLAEFIQCNKHEHEDVFLQNLLKSLEEKIITYARLQGPNQIRILANFLKFSLRMKKVYKAHIKCSRSSILLLVTFSSRKGYELYKKDLENGIIGEQILKLLLYPPYLSSFGLKADDIEISLNGSLLTQYKGKKNVKHVVILICCISPLGGTMF